MSEIPKDTQPILNDSFPLYKDLAEPCMTNLKHNLNSSEVLSGIFGRRTCLYLCSGHWTSVVCDGASERAPIWTDLSFGGGTNSLKSHESCEVRRKEGEGDQNGRRIMIPLFC